MGKIILITGGSRSGKSRYAQQLAENLGQKKVFIATCPVFDSEMDTRIAKHKREREGKDWHTIEEETDLDLAIEKNAHYDVILIDCLTLWINNLLYASQREKRSISEKEIESLCAKIIKISKQHSGTIFFVTNEIGSGIVPDNETARHYRDLVGRCNQSMATGADEVILVSCGIPLTLKSDDQR